MKPFRLFMAFVVVIAWGLTALAIGEVTPTPSPNAPQPATATPRPVMPTPRPMPTAIIPPTPVLTPFEQASEALSEGNFEAVISILTPYLAENSTDSEAFAIRGIALARLARYELSIDDFTQAIAIVPYSWEYYTLRGGVYGLMQESGEAILDLNQAIALNPRYLSAYDYRATVALTAGDTLSADIDLLILEGLRAQLSGDNASAIAQFDEALSLIPDNRRVKADVLYNRALTRYIDGDRLGAIEDYSAGMEVASDMHDLYLGRGIAYRETERAYEAGVDFLRRIELLEANTFNDMLSLGEEKIIFMDYGNVYRFTFDASAGDILTFTAREAETSGVVDPLIVVLDAQGQVLAGDDDFGGELDSEIEGLEIPADGSYTLVVSHANGGYTGDVRVLITKP